MHLYTYNLYILINVLKNIRIEQIDQNLVQSQHELNPLDDWQSQSMHQNRNDCS